MQRNLIIFLLVCGIVHRASSQQVFDALDLGRYQPVATARIHAMGGNSNALGGDISSLYHNPAGLAQFRTHEALFSPGLYFNQRTMEYNQADFKDQRIRMNTGASGLVLSMYNQKKRKIKRTNFAIGISQTANYNTAFHYKGTNRNSSFSEKWVEELINNNVRNFSDALGFSPAGASLAVENYLVDSIVSNNEITGYKTNADINNMNLDQSFTYRISGSANEFSLGLASHQTEKFYYGFTLGIPFMRRAETTTVQEKDLSGNADNDFEQFTYRENITTKGAGILFRGGVLYKPFEYFRIGFNIQTPAFYTLTRSADAQLETSVENYARRINNDNTKPQTFKTSTQDINNGNLYTYDYNVMTPWQMSLALAYVFRETDDVKKQRAMITASVDFINHQAIRFSASEAAERNTRTSSFYAALNQDIKAMYRPAIHLSLGGELKFHTIMFRGGFRYQQSPFEKGALPDVKGYQLIPSLGIGYRDKGIFADLSYSHAWGDGIHFPYILSGNIYPYAATRQTNGQLLFTIGCKF
jgi:hypothetical protein